MCEHFNPLTPIKKYGELRCHGGCQFIRDRENGLLPLSQRTFSDALVKKFRVVSENSVLLSVGVKLEEYYYVDEVTEN